MYTFNFCPSRQFCFGGSPKQQSVPPPPPPAPAPTPTGPVEVVAQTADQRQAQAKQLRYGILSTIKTSAAGITGQGPDLVTSQASGKKTLGG